MRTLTVVAIVITPAIGWAADNPDGAALIGNSKSKTCITRRSYAQAGGVQVLNRLVMSNDRGWCGQLRQTVLYSRLVGAPTHLATKPEHGEVSITVLATGTVVAYRPQPDFRGNDAFSVVNEMLNITLPYSVTVR